MPGPNFGKTWNNENCYAYAINKTGVRRDPGNGNFFEGGVVNPVKLRKAVTSDGATIVTAPQTTPTAGSMPGKYLIAVKCDTKSINYHVLRRDETSGLWYHKVPMTLPSIYMTGAFIPIANDWNTRQAGTEAGLLMVWIGYYWVPNNGL